MTNMNDSALNVKPILPKPISDENLIAAAKAAQDRGATDTITVIRKHLPAGKLATCPPDKRAALVNELNTLGCPADALPLFAKLAQVAKGHGGQFVLVGLHNLNRPIIEYIPNRSDVLPALIKAAARIVANEGYSLHIAPALFRDDLPEGSRGGEDDVIGLLAVVCDFDKEHDPATRTERLPFDPWCENETSPGNFHCWRFLDRPYSVAEAKPIVTALLRSAGVDTTQSLDHLFRVPGSINIPTDQKIKTGKREPGAVRAKLQWGSNEGLDPDTFTPDLTLTEVREAIVTKYGEAAFAPIIKSSENFDWEDRATAYSPMENDAIRAVMDDPKHAKDRSNGLGKAYAIFRNHGYTPDETIDAIQANGDTILGGKADEKGDDWLRADIERWWRKQSKIETPSETFADAAANRQADGTIAPTDELEAAIIERQEIEAKLDKPGLRFSAEDFEREQKRLNEYLNLFNRHFCIANMGSITQQAKIIEFKKDGKILNFMHQEDFQLRFKPMRVWVRSGENPRPKEVSQIWLTWPKRRQYLDDGLVFAPGQPMEWEGGLNRWRGFAIEPKAGDWSLLLDLIERVLCGGNTVLSEYILNWLAHMVQRPGVLIGSCIALRSDHEGAGKGTLGKTIGSFFGPNYAYIQRGDDFTGRFNGSLAECLFAVLDEAMYAGNHEASEILKTLVSDDQRRTEQKNMPVEYIQNHINVMVFGNNEWLIRTGLKNRRFVYVDVPETYPPNDPYWLQFYVEQDHAYRPGVKHKLPPLKMRQAMLHALLHRDISKFDPRTIPHTAEEGRQKILSMSGVQGYIYAILQNGEIEFPSQGANRISTRQWRKDGLVIRRSDFHNAICHYWTTRKERGPVPSRDSVGRALQRMLPLCVKANRTRDKNINPDYSQCYKFDPLDACRAAFDTAFGSPLKWEPLPVDDADEGPGELLIDPELGLIDQ